MMSAVLHIATTVFNTIAVDRGRASDLSTVIRATEEALRVRVSGLSTMTPALAADGQGLAGDRDLLNGGQLSRRPSFSLFKRHSQPMSLQLLSSISSTDRYPTSLTPRNPQKNRSEQHFWPNLFLGAAARVKLVNTHLDTLSLDKHPGLHRAGGRGFDFLGYHFEPEGLTVARKKLERFVERLARYFGAYIELMLVFARACGHASLIEFTTGGHHYPGNVSLLTWLESAMPVRVASQIVDPTRQQL